MPTTTKIKVFIVGGGHQYISLMFQLGYFGAATVEDADIVLFTGGSDVNPELYDEVCMQKTHFDRGRDEYESNVYARALTLGIPMVGICRGGQFLNVMNGGKMYQHVTGHCANHVAYTVPFGATKSIAITVTSTHHQMMIPAEREQSIILLVANESTERHTAQKMEVGKNKEAQDVEAVMYTDTNCFCFQPHPEFPSCPNECVDFFDECLDNWIIPMIPERKGK